MCSMGEKETHFAKTLYRYTSVFFNWNGFFEFVSDWTLDSFIAVLNRIMSRRCSMQNLYLLVLIEN